MQRNAKNESLHQKILFTRVEWERLNDDSREKVTCPGFEPATAVLSSLDQNQLVYLEGLR